MNVWRRWHCRRCGFWDDAEAPFVPSGTMKSLLMEMQGASKTDNTRCRKCGGTSCAAFFVHPVGCVVVDEERTA